MRHLSPIDTDQKVGKTKLSPYASEFTTESEIPNIGTVIAPVYQEIADDEPW